MSEEEFARQFRQEVITNILQEPAAIVLFFIASIYWFYQTILNFQRNGPSRRLYINTFILFFTVVVLPVPFILLTEALSIRAVQYKVVAEENQSKLVDLLRWLTLYAVVCPLVVLLTYQYNKFKSGKVAFAHLAVLLAGWVIGRWTGIILVSIPLLAFAYILIYYLAQIIYPASSPNDPNERRNKFQALTWYMWRLQYPVWVAPNGQARNIEKRIGGNNIKGFGQPGIIWTHSHQVAGTSFGVRFSQVTSPGISFLTRLENPVALVDLRTQLRTTTIKVVTQDGILINCVLFMSFKIDDSSWGELDRIEDIHPLLRRSPVLRYGIELDSNLESNFPYSSARIQAALGATGVNNLNWLDDNTTDIHWDEIVIQRITEIARIEISARTLTELWTPRTDNRGDSALNEMATAITNRARPRLREIGVRLFTARVVNFIISEDDPIRKQLIESWSTIFTQRVESVLLDGKTEAKILTVRAQASAADSFLQATTSSLSQARRLNQNFPKQIIALNFISTLQQILTNQDSDDLDKQIERLGNLRGLSLGKR